MTTQELKVWIDDERPEDPYYILRTSWVSVRHKYVWKILGKVASSTTMNTLRLLEGSSLTGKHAPSLHDFETDQVVEMLTSSDWFRFCFVRNPYTRLFSAYKSKIGDPDGDPAYREEKNEIRDLFGYPKYDDGRVPIVSFRDFVQYVHDGNRSFDAHWSIQVKQLAMERVSYDIIGRFETFACDFKRILLQLGATSEAIASAEKVHGQTARICLPAVYDRKLAGMVYETYKEDFEALGYDRDSWMFQ